MDEKIEHEEITAGEYPPFVVINVIWNAFFPKRGLKPVVKEFLIGVTDVERPKNAVEPKHNDITNEMTSYGYFRLDAQRLNPRGSRDRVVIYILSSTGKYTHYSPDLRSLLNSISMGPLAKENRLDEVIIVAEDDFFKKKNLIEVIKKFQREGASGTDRKGSKIFYNAYNYRVFATDVTQNVISQRFKIMEKEDIKSFLQAERLNERALPSIFSNDPQIIWLGGRIGQCVEVIRDSENSGEANMVRLIE